MRTTEAFGALVREEFKRFADKLPYDTATVTETTERGLVCLRLDPKCSFSSPIEILLEDGAGCTVFVGSHGRFEHLPEDADLVAGFIEAALYGRVRETVWEWNGHPLRAITRVQIREVTYTHVWETLIGMLARLMLAPWVRTREIEYEPYFAINGPTAPQTG